MKRRWLKILLGTVLVPILAMTAMLFTQTVVAHRPGCNFTPDHKQVNLASVLAQESLSDEDYALLLCQTGLGRHAVDQIRSTGETGKTDILNIQQQFSTQAQVSCDSLLGWFTREDHLENDTGEQVWAPKLVDLQPGDIILTLSTHSLGWRHGHAGLVVETDDGLATLKCVA